ncbi:MAG: NAD(P)/FAD-dependent oxidoreductase [Chloroflexi bacterium]|nr:NAD(P)/FAD-dependent oxidoreductase [Chloroflexota bacterium]
MYDAIVVGARCAGAPTAMLLARAGHRVLMVDRDTFPSDVISTHFIHPWGVAHLADWGLLDRVLATNCPELIKITFHPAGVAPGGPFGELPDGRPIIALAPRRTVLDPILIEGAVEAGVEFREGFSVRGVIRDSGGRVTGVTGRHAGAEVAEEASIVIGADGLRSRIARLVEAEEYDRVPTLLFAYYAYWGGLPTDGATFGFAPGNAGILIFPTNDEQSCVAVAWPIERFDEVRGDVAGHHRRAIEQLLPDFAERMQAPQGGVKFLGMADLPHYIRKPYGPGWALAGDAGYHCDPTNGLGIGNAFEQAVWLARALDAGLSGQQPMDEALAEFQRTRDGGLQERYDNNLAAARALNGAATE